MADLQLARLLGDTPGSACRHAAINGTVDALDTFVLCRCAKFDEYRREERRREAKSRLERRVRWN